MNSFVKRFCEKICRVFDSWNMCNIYDTVVDTVPDEVSANVDMFHARVRVWVVTTSDRALIVAVKDRRSGLFETEFVERERSQIICQVQCEQERYSASHDDNATMVCCLDSELQAIGPPPHSIM